MTDTGGARRSSLFAALVLAGCRGAPAPDEAAPPPSRSAAAPTAVPAANPTANANTGTAASASPTRASFAGTWTGTYVTSAHRIELPPKAGGLPEWAAASAAPPGHEGHGTLTATVSADGTVTGTATGSLGDQDVRGTFDGDSLTARLVPKTASATAYSGTLIARRAETRAEGTLSASTGDGRSVREGKVTLTRGGDTGQAP